jgi:two-component system, OmpR family, response regulator
MKVLVVEDNKKLARFLTRALVEEGYVVDCVAEGPTAVAQVERIAYDLVVLDWMIPEQDGLSVCRSLRARGSSPIILMLTARGEVAERIAGLDAGADDYMTKPFDLGEFLARVRALSRRGGGDLTLRVGPLVVDRGAHQVLVDGQRLALTPREYALLSYLARKAGRVVPRTELMSKVWETGYDTGSNVVEAHVKNLRDKLGKWGTLIRTIRGIGYQLETP